MPGYKVKRGTTSLTLMFLQYLNDWFYRELSQDAHFSVFSAIRTGAIYLEALNPNHVKLDIDWDKVRGIVVGRTLVLVLSLFSEVDAHFRFGRNEKLRYLWCFLGEHGPEVREVYDQRYRELLDY